MNSSIPLSVYPSLYPPLPLPDWYAFLAKTSWKQATLAIIIIFLVFAYCLAAFTFYNRSYPPFKSKQLEVLGISLFSITFFALAELQTYQIVDQTGIFADCIFWNVWSNGAIGLNLFLAVCSYRFRRLFYIMVMAKQAKGLVFWLPIIAFYLPTVIVSCYASFMPWAWFLPYPCMWKDSLYPGCQATNQTGLYVLYLLVVLQAGYCFYLQIRISRIRKAFNEFSEMKWVLFSITSSCIIALALNASQQSDWIWTKIVLGIFPAAISLNAILMPLYVPMIGFLRDKEAYCAKWRKGMRDEELPESLSYISHEGSSQSQSQTGGSNISQTGILTKDKNGKKDKDKEKLKNKYSFARSNFSSTKGSMNQSQINDS